MTADPPADLPALPLRTGSWATSTARDKERVSAPPWLMSRLHAFDLSRFGINIDCLPVLDVPVEGSSNVIGNRAYGGDPTDRDRDGRGGGRRPESRRGCCLS